MTKRKTGEIDAVVLQISKSRLWNKAYFLPSHPKTQLSWIPRESESFLLCRAKGSAPMRWDVGFCGILLLV